MGVVPCGARPWRSFGVGGCSGGEISTFEDRIRLSAPDEALWRCSAFRGDVGASPILAAMARTFGTLNVWLIPKAFSTNSFDRFSRPSGRRARPRASDFIRSRGVARARAVAFSPRKNFGAMHSRRSAPLHGRRKV